MSDNQTTKFLLPLLEAKSPERLLKRELIGAFVGDKDKPQWDGRLLLAYYYQPTINWARFENAIMKIPEYKGSYEYVTNENSIIVVYGFLMKDLEKDYEKVVEGKYSEVSPESKLKIEKFWKVYSGTSLPEDIMNKQESVKFYWKKVERDPKELCAEGEVWYKPDLEEEMFNKQEYL